MVAMNWQRVRSLVRINLTIFVSLQEVSVLTELRLLGISPMTLTVLHGLNSTAA